MFEHFFIQLEGLHMFLPLEQKRGITLDRDIHESVFVCQMRAALVPTSACIVATGKHWIKLIQGHANNFVHGKPTLNPAMINRQHAFTTFFCSLCALDTAIYELIRCSDSMGLTVCTNSSVATNTKCWTSEYTAFQSEGRTPSA